MAFTPLSPLWWVQRLHKTLRDRQKDIELYDRYYRGQPRYPWLPHQAQEEFERLLKLTRSNYMGLVVDAVAERMEVKGFRIGDSLQADKATWRIWQANNMDDGSDQAILEALICGQSYLLVAPNPRDAATPLMFVEHPSQAIVEYQPGTARRLRAAGLKVWLDDWTGLTMATLYLPDRIYKYQAKVQQGAAIGNINWQPREVAGEMWPAGNPLGEVPLIELPNNPRLLCGGISEIDDVIEVQDRICKTIADRLMTQDFGAFPQKWATGFPETDNEGNENKIDIGRNRMVRSDIAETQFGQWAAAPLDPYSAAKREDVKDIASRTRTPAQYLLGEMSNVNGETLKAAESGLVSKTRQRQRPVSEGLEESVRLVRRIAGIAGPDDAIMETIWRDPQYRTEGELVDALVKLGLPPVSLPRRALWERYGLSPPEMDRYEQMLATQAAADAAQASALFKLPTAADTVAGGQPTGGLVGAGPVNGRAATG